MKGLILCGAKCNHTIWDQVKVQLEEYDFDYVSYSHEVLQSADSIKDIATWVRETYNNRHYDVIIGHSMGGQVALELLKLMRVQPSKLILIESNPVPCGIFYKNLMTKENLERFASYIKTMFDMESPYYSEKLLLSLQDNFNLIENVREYSGKIYAIYGDRGQSEYDNRYKELRLPEDILNNITIRFITQACHLPMIENPVELGNVIREILH